MQNWLEKQLLVLSQISGTQQKDVHCPDLSSGKGSKLDKLLLSIPFHVLSHNLCLLMLGLFFPSFFFSFFPSYPTQLYITNMMKQHCFAFLKIATK